MKLTPAKVALGLGLVAIVALAVTLPRFARRLTFFRVRQVDVIGTRYLDEADVAARLGLTASSSTFDPLAPVQAAAAAIPGVVTARAERVLPGTLRITVTEAAPVAVAALADHVVLIDSRGRTLPFDPTRVPANLPIAVPDSSVAALLARVQRFTPSLYVLIESARVERGDVVFDIGPGRIRVKPEADDAVLQAVIAVLGHLNRSNTAWHEIDARYHDRVFIQKGAA